MKLPPHITRADFTKALRAFERVVGKEWVLVNDDDLLTYRDAYSPYRGEADEREASAAVAPSSTEQVQEVVRIANRYQLSLYAISTGKNLGYGGSAPVLSGCVVLDLKRMNRILEVDERNAYVVVEPGVSYFELYRHLQERGSRLWMDIPDPGWGSLVGNALDHGVGFTMTHLRNHFDAHCGMEVVLANGEVMRTGMGALPNAATWQQYKAGFGPWIDGMFSQSNFGVVTKMGFWLAPEPEAYLKGRVEVFGHADLVPLIEIMNHLENTGVFNGFPDLHSPLTMAAPVADIHTFFEQGPPSLDPEHLALLGRDAPPGELEAYGRRKGIPYWACDFTFYGPEEVIRAQWKHVQARYRKAIPDTRTTDREFYTLPLTAQQKEKVHGTEFGIPSLRLFSLGVPTKWSPDASRGHIWFSPVIPRTGEATLKALQVFRDFSRREGVRLQGASMPVAFLERSFVLIFAFAIADDATSNQKNRALFKKLIKLAAEHGWGEYRTSTVYQDDVMATYSFNNHALLRFHETIKDAIDPNGILSPGRYGIWPKNLRKRPV